jgi:hypothetical protein
MTPAAGEITGQVHGEIGNRLQEYVAIRIDRGRKRRIYSHQLEVVHRSGHPYS